VIPNADFSFLSPGHAFQSDLTYYVTVTVTRVDAAGGSTTSAPAVVEFNAYNAPVQGIEVATVDASNPVATVTSIVPATITITSPSGAVTTVTGSLTVTATLHGDPGATTPSSIIIAVVPPDADPSLNVQVVEQIGNVTITASFDVRTVNVNGYEFATVTFGYILFPGFPNTPVLRYVDPTSGLQELVFGSTTHFYDANGPTQPDPPYEVFIDPAAQTITVTFDTTSTPTLEALKGTVFTITIPVPAAPAAAPVNPPQANVQLPAATPPAVPANFISTPQLTLTLKLPQNYQTITSQAPLIQDVGSKGSADEPADDLQQQVIDAIRNFFQFLNNLLGQAPDQPMPRAGMWVAADLDPNAELLAGDGGPIDLGPPDASRARFFELGEAACSPADRLTWPDADETLKCLAAARADDEVQQPAERAALTSLFANDWSRPTAPEQSWSLLGLVAAGTLLAADRADETDETEDVAAGSPPLLTGPAS